MIRSLLLAVLYSSCMFGFVIEEELHTEITTRWRSIWDQQLQATRNVSTSDLNHYVELLINFTEDDADVAEQVITELLQEPAWKEFVVHRDMETTVQFINVMTLKLQQRIWQGSQLTFPPSLEEINEEISRSGLSDDDFCEKLRQSFLAFTIVVSHMDYLTRQ